VANVLVKLSVDSIQGYMLILQVTCIKAYVYI